MPELTLLRDLSVVMVAAAGMTLLCHVLKQPVVIGYLMAGFLIGPHTPPFSMITDVHSIETMAELGLVFLMFAVGLEFSLPKLRKVGIPAALAATLEVIGMISIGYALGRTFGWSTLDSFYLGAILSISSTTIIIKVFSDLKFMKEEFAQAVFGILILEDVVAIVLLTVLSGLGASQAEGEAALRAFAQISFFVVLFLVLGLSLVPRFLGWVGRFHSKELLGIVTLGLCIASALLANHLGLSIALGAFLMGSIIGVSPEIDNVEHWFHPIRDMFSAIFFVATGMLINPSILWEYKSAVLVIAAATILAKVLSGAAGSFVAGYSLKTSFKVGMSLAQIGEFSFVFAGLALKDPRAGNFLYPLAVGVSALTTLSTPYLIRSSDGVVEGLLRGLGPQMNSTLDRYHLWITRWRDSQMQNTGVVSRYVVRLLIYVALFVAALSMFSFFTRELAGERVTQSAAWLLGFMVCLPLMRAVATYFTHFLLLVSTEAMVRLRALKLLEKLAVHRFYNTVHGVVMLLLALIFVLKAGSSLPTQHYYWSIITVTVLTAFLLRHRVVMAYDRMESVLDEALGLATSEPLRQAALQTDEGEGALSESLERIFLNRKAAAVQHTIRSLGLREKTGASLVAVYRRGKLQTNPSPEMTLLANDTLVVLGDKNERKKARILLRGELLA